ncbi:uncharacterized protein LOC132269578 [Cornus florida]|uniref:uncharacterized protein LOC132269578 n=1 Tax=Cornus florida TaxID=4283 RepID=UPI002898552E|nr:uncharacterized protein LOC132269578 [Cornus florida]
MQWGSWDFPGLDGESQNLEAPVGADAAGKYEQELVHQKPSAERSYSSVVSNTSASLPQKKWSSLFKTSTTFDTLKENEEDSTLASELTAPHSDHNMEWVSPCDAPYPDTENQLLEAHADESVVEKHDNELIGLKSDCKYSYTSSPLTEATGSVPSATSFETLPSAGTRQEEEYPKRVESDLNLLHSDESNMGWESLATLHLDGESQTSDTESVIDKLIQQGEALKASQLKQIRKISSLEQKRV